MKDKSNAFRFFLLAFFLIWIGVSGAFMVSSIKSYTGERQPSDLRSIGASGAFIFFGILAIWAAWSVRKRHNELTLDAGTAQDKLFGRLAEQASSGSMAQEEIRCEKCGLPLGPGLLDCPHQAQGTCPYHIEQPLGGPRKRHQMMLIWGVAAIMGGWMLTRLAPGFTPQQGKWILLSVYICAVPLGLLGIVIGLLALFADILTVYNTVSGQMWQRYTIFGYTIYQATARALQPVSLPARLRRPMKYPASICALYQSRDATHIFYMALLSVLGQGAVTLKYAMTSRMFFNWSAPSLTGRSFVLSPGKGRLKVADKLYPAGKLEERIARAVEEWSQRTDENIHSHRRAFRHFLTLEDVIHVVFEGERGAPDYWLIHEVVGVDASQRGMGRKKGFLKEQFETLPEYQDSVLAEYDVVLDFHERFQASQPDIASDLWQKIKIHIEHLKPSG